MAIQISDLMNDINQRLWQCGRQWPMTVVEKYERDTKPLRSGGYGDRHMTRKGVKKALRAGLGREK
jgi:hypothetical protein